MTERIDVVPIATNDATNDAFIHIPLADGGRIPASDGGRIPPANETRDTDGDDDANDIHNNPSSSVGENGTRDATGEKGETGEKGATGEKGEPGPAPPRPTSDIIFLLMEILSKLDKCFSGN